MSERACAQVDKPLLVIEPGSSWTGVNLAEIWRFRDLLVALAVRDLKLRYRQTALGVAWVLLQPLLAAGIFAFVFGKVAKLPSGGVPYFLFAYAGMLGWTVFSQTITKAGFSLVGNSHLISKVYFPRLILPLSSLFSVMIDFVVALAMMFILMVIYGVNPGINLLTLPVWFGLLVMLALGCSFFVAAMVVSYRDVQYVMPVLLQLLTYASPVAYGIAAVPERYRHVFMFNPLAPLLEGFRYALLGHGDLQWGPLGLATLVSAVALIVGALTFQAKERQFADVI